MTAPRAAAPSDTAAVILMLDPPNRQGYAGGTSHEDIDALASALRDVWPDLPVHVQQWIPAAEVRVGGAGPEDVEQSPFFTDARRLAPLIDRCRFARLLVVRPACVLLPPAVLRMALRCAADEALDVLTVPGVPDDVFYVASRRALEVAAAAGAIPGAVTIPGGLARLASTGVDWEDVGVHIAERLPVDGPWRTAAAALPARWWRRGPPADIIGLAPDARLLAAVDAERVDAAREHARVAAACGAAGVRPPRILVVLPSNYQTGAHAAWTELSGDLSPTDVAFAVGRGTALVDVLTGRGFRVFGVRDGLASGSADAAMVEQLLRTLAPAVVHIDGADGAEVGRMAAAGGARVVQHVRLNVVDRFQPAFAHATVIVGVSAWLCSEIAARVDRPARVVHIPDGVRVETYAVRRPPERASLHDSATVLSCLCAGRVEPAKAQLRVLDIFRALADRRPARLTLVGPCGSDASYCDEVLDRMATDPGRRISWLPWTSSIAHLHRQAHVVLVGSRNEALGMVGLEALAAGALLVAQHSTGYEAIIDPRRHEGVLFDAEESGSRIADRVLAALADHARYETAARRKAADTFDARVIASRLMALWRELITAG